MLGTVTCPAMVAGILRVGAVVEVTRGPLVEGEFGVLTDVVVVEVPDTTTGLDGQPPIGAGIISPAWLP